MVKKIRKFALVVVDNFDEEIDRFNLDYSENPKNLGFEIEFTTLETKLTTHFTSAREKKIPTTLNLNFLAPNAYRKVNAFKRFVQKYTNKKMLFEYDDTTEIKYWEGKIQKLGQEELTEWGGLVCPISFLPGTPKYIKKDSILGVQTSQSGKSYPFEYPYTYSQTVIQDNIIDNTYFDEIPLRIIVYGRMTNPQISLVENDTNKVYSIVRFENLGIEEGEHIVIDAIQSKILLYRDGRYISAYDYVSKQSNLDSFLYAKGDTKSRIVISLNPLENGYLRASYRQYTL